MSEPLYYANAGKVVRRRTHTSVGFIVCEPPSGQWCTPDMAERIAGALNLVHQMALHEFTPPGGLDYDQAAEAYNRWTGEAKKLMTDD